MNKKESMIDEVRDLFREVEDNPGCHTKGDFADRLIEWAWRYNLIDDEDSFKANFDEELGLVKHFSDGYLQTVKVLMEQGKIAPERARDILSHEFVTFTAAHLSGERYRDLKSTIDRKMFEKYGKELFQGKGDIQHITVGENGKTTKKTISEEVFNSIFER